MLRELDLSNCGLSIVPQGLTSSCALQTSLQRLSLNGNAISELPDDIAELSALTQLSIRDNKLDYTLPTTLAHIKNLQQLNIAGNLLQALPQRAATPLEELKQYLENAEQNGVAWRHVKVLLLGEEGAGKTSLVRALREFGRKPRTFLPKIFGQAGAASAASAGTLSAPLSPLSSLGSLSPDSSAPNTTQGAPLSTDGVEVSEWNIAGCPLLFSAWDFGGQEIFYSTHQFFLTSRSLYVIVFSLLNENLSRVEHWLHQVKMRAQAVRVLLVGTHRDHKVCTRQYLATVEKSLSQYTERFPIKGIFFVSSQSNEGMAELTAALAEIGMTSGIRRQTIPVSWEKLFWKLELKKRQGLQYLKFSQIAELALRAGIASHHLAEPLEFLHNNGVINWLRVSGLGNEDSDNLIVLDAHWLSRVFSSIVSLRHNWVAKGLLELSSLKHLWKNFAEELQPQLIELLEKFELVFRMSDGKRLLIPSLLPQAVPSTLRNEWSQSGVANGIVQHSRVFDFQFIPIGLFAKLLVRVLHVSTVTVLALWRHGILLEHGLERALLCERNERGAITLDVRVGVNEISFSLLCKLVDTIEVLIESCMFSKTLVRLIPCSHCVSKGSGAQTVFTQEQCIAAIREGGYLFCQQTPVSVRSQAPDLALQDVAAIDNSRLQIGEVIGKGAHGTVRKAALDGNTVVALKELGNQSESNEEHVNYLQFQKEVSIMSFLDHPNLVKLYGVTLSPLRMVLEFMPLGDLFNFIERGELSAQSSLRIHLALDIARGMEYLQTRSPPIIHRDLRSPNVFLDRKGNGNVHAKVADFGLARQSAPYLNEALLTWRWLAPEVLQPGPAGYDERSDIYSYGMLLYEIATEKTPFSEFEEAYGENGQFREINCKLDVVRVALRPTPPQTTPLSPLMQLCWQSNPAARPKFSALIERLRSVLLLECLDSVLQDTELDTKRETDDEFEGLLCDVLSISHDDELRPSATIAPALDDELSSRVEEVRVSSERRKPEVQFLDSASNEQVAFERELEPIHSAAVTAMCWIPLNNTMWCGCNDGTLFVWNELHQLVRSFNMLSTSISAIQWTTLHIGAVFVASDNKISIWRAEGTKRERVLIKPHEAHITTLGFFKVGSLMLSGDASGLVCCWSLQSLDNPITTLALGAPVHAIVCKDDASLVLHARELALVNPYSLLVLKRVPIKMSGDFGGLLVIGPEIWLACGETIAVMEYGGSFLIVDQLKVHSSTIRELQQVGAEVWSASNDNDVVRWDITKRAPIALLPAQHLASVQCIRPVGTSNHKLRIYTGSDDRRVCLWRLFKSDPTASPSPVRSSLRLADELQARSLGIGSAELSNATLPEAETQANEDHEDTSALSKQPWWFGDCDVDQANLLLDDSPKGIYLVRENASEKGGIVVSFVDQDGRVKHARILVSGGGYTWPGRPMQSSIRRMIEELPDLLQAYVAKPAVMPERANRARAPAKEREFYSPAPTEYAGWLTKCGKSTLLAKLNKKKRWVAIKNGQVSYQARPEDQKPIDCFPVSSLSNVSARSSLFVKEENSFSIVAGNRTYHFLAPSAAAHKYWLDAFLFSRGLLPQNAYIPI
jgi:serine/threonine protein kinase/GTPase SAR1 family protein